MIFFSHRMLTREKDLMFFLSRARANSFDFFCLLSLTSSFATHGLFSREKRP